MDDCGNYDESSAYQTPVSTMTPVSTIKTNTAVSSSTEDFIRTDERTSNTNICYHPDANSSTTNIGYRPDANSFSTRYLSDANNCTGNGISHQNASGFSSISQQNSTGNLIADDSASNMMYSNSFHCLNGSETSSAVSEKDVYNQKIIAGANNNNVNGSEGIGKASNMSQRVQHGVFSDMKERNNHINQARSLEADPDKNSQSNSFNHFDHVSNSSEASRRQSVDKVNQAKGVEVISVSVASRLPNGSYLYKSFPQSKGSENELPIRNVRFDDRKRSTSGNDHRKLDKININGASANNSSITSNSFGSNAELLKNERQNVESVMNPAGISNGSETSHSVVFSASELEFIGEGNFESNGPESIASNVSSLNDFLDSVVADGSTRTGGESYIYKFRIRADII